MGELPIIDQMRDRLHKLKAARESAKIDQTTSDGPSAPDSAQRQEEIRKLAQEMFLNRTGLDPENKEKGPSEFDLRAAEVAYNAVQKQGELDKSAAQPDASGKQRMEESLRIKAKENQRLINSQGYFPKKGMRNVAKVSTDEPASMKTVVETTPVPPAAPSGPETGPEVVPAAPDIKPEDGSTAPEKTLEGLKADLEAKRAKYARFDLDISGRWNKLKKVLGLGAEEIKDSGVEEKKKEYKEALKKYRDAKQVSMGNLTKEQAAELYSEFTAGEAVLFLEVKGDENAKMKKEKGEWPESVMNGYMNIVKNFRDLSFKKKILISAGIMAGGVAAGMTFGVVGASVFTIAGAGYRAISGGASGLGLKKLMDAISAKREKKTVSKEAESILSQDDWLNQLNAKLDEAVNTIDTRIGRMESKDLTRRRVATYAGIFVGSGAMAQIIQSTGFGGFVKEKIFGGGVIKPSVSDHVTEAVKPSAASEITQPQSGSHMNAEISDTGQPHQAEYSGGSRATEGGANFAEQSQTEKAGSFIEEVRTSPAAGAEIPESTAKASSAMEDFAKSPAAGAEVQAPEIAKPQLEEIVAVKIKGGGTMWGSIENNIRANPSAYGLDPNDPSFTKDMHRMTKQMLDEFASRKGMSYEQLDQIARMKLRAGDTFKIIYDPSTEEISLDDFHGKAFGADVSQATVVEEIASNKPPASPTSGKFAPEDLKPRTGIAEHQPAKDAGKITGMEEIEADYQKDLADRNYARAVRAEQDLSALHERQASHLENVGWEAHHRQVLATRGLLNGIVQGSGIGRNTSFWEGSASDWYSQIADKENLIAQDVQLDDQDQIKKLNLNLGRLKQLFAIMAREGFRPGESNGECLARIMNDPINVQNINKIVLRK